MPQAGAWPSPSPSEATLHHELALQGADVPGAQAVGRLALAQHCRHTGGARPGQVKAARRLPCPLGPPLLRQAVHAAPW
jgi:hypothetical protein